MAGKKTGAALDRCPQTELAVDCDGMLTQMKSMRKRLQAGIAALEKNGGSSDKLTILYRQMRKVGWKIVFLERYPEKYDGTTCLRCGKKVATAVLQETPEALFCPHCQKLLAGSAGADIKFGEEPGDKYRLSLEEVAA